MRVVLDTNVLIDAASDDFVAPAKLVTAVIDGEVTALVTPAMEREYTFKTAELITNEAYRERLADFLAAAEQVSPAPTEVQIDDRDDRKFFQAAVGGQADLVITADRHLLQIGEIGRIRMVTPPEAWVIFEEQTESSGEWNNWIQGLGIGR